MNSDSNQARLKQLTVAFKLLLVAAETTDAEPSWAPTLIGVTGALVILINRGLPKLSQSQVDRFGIIMGIGLGLCLPLIWPDHSLLSVIAVV